MASILLALAAGPILTHLGGHMRLRRPLRPFRIVRPPAHLRPAKHGRLRVRDRHFRLTQVMGQSLSLSQSASR